MATALVRQVAALDVRTGDDADLAPLRAAIEREGGAIVDDDSNGLAALFSLPDAALRALTASPARARAALRTAALSRGAGAEDAHIAAARAAATDTAAGAIALDVASAGLAARPVS